MADTDILRETRKWRLYVEANLGGSGANIDPGTIEGQAARWDNTGSVWEPVNETAFGAVRDMYIGIPVNEGKLIFVGTISNLADERAHVGFDGSSLEFEIKNLTASSSITIKATDAGLNEITFLNANPNGDTLLRGDTGLRLESSSGVIEMEPGGNGYFEFNSAGILDMLGNGVQSGVLRITEGVSPFGDVAGRGQLWADSADSRIKWTDDGGTDNTLAYLTDITGGTPGGADTNVQFNNAGAFGGSADFTWNGARLGFTNAIGINWEDLMGVEVEHLIFEEVAFGASPIAASTELYVDWDGMAGDTTFVDDDGNTWNQRNASAVISSFAKFGPGSMVIQNGTVGGFGSSDPSFPNFSGDFSFGFWYYLDDADLSSSFTGGNTIFGRRNTGATGGWRWRVLINNGNLSFNYRVGSPGSENRFRQFGPATVREQWLYCVVERDGGVIRAYVGGSQVGSDVNDNDTLFMGGGDTQVSAEGFSGINDDFYIDDITILNGATIYEGSGGGEPPGDPANPSGDFETFVVGDPTYRTLIDGEDVFLGKQTEQVAKTITAASGGLLVNNQNTGAGFERVLTESDASGVPAGTDEQTLVYVGTTLTATDFLKHDNQNVITIDDQFGQTHTWEYNSGGGSLLEFSSTNISDFRVPRTLSIAEGAGGAGVLALGYSGNLATFNTNENATLRVGNSTTGISIVEMFQGTRIRWLEVGGLDPIEQWNDGTHLRFDLSDGGIDGFRLDGNASIFLNEQASAEPSIAAYGQLWVRNDSPNVLVFTDDTGVDTVLGSGGATPGGADTQVQYNSAGSFAGDPNFTWDSTNEILQISGSVPRFRIDNTSAFAEAQFYFESPGAGLAFFQQGSFSGSNAQIAQTDGSQGNEGNFIEFRRDAEVALYEDGVETARTAPAASGGFEVNNTLTGSGFERVLTTSDAGGGAAAKVGGVANSADSATSDTVLSDDVDLNGFVLSQSTTYRFEGMIFFQTAGSGDAKWDFQLSGAGGLVFSQYSWIAMATDGPRVDEDAQDVTNLLTTATISITAGERIGVLIRGTVQVNGAGDATLDFRFAQDTSDASALNREIGSYIVFEPLTAL